KSAFYCQGQAGELTAFLFVSLTGLFCTHGWDKTPLFPPVNDKYVPVFPTGWDCSSIKDFISPAL
ncbi:hypothetical protein AVEN_164065-1, partial [Araneus ventricosus]